MPRIELERCGAGHKPTLDALFQLYTHDFSEYWAGQPRGEVDEQGRFPDYPGLERFWKDADREAFLIRVEGHVAGFVLLSAEAHSGVPADQGFVGPDHSLTVAAKYLNDRAGSIYAGTNEIQRNIMAKAVLGL